VKQYTTCSLIVTLLFTATLAGCGGSESEPDPKAGKMVYVDTKTGKAFVGDVTGTPAVHPQTGNRTLMAALYCPKCSIWHAVPPLEEINQIPNATRCPKTRVPLTIDGPWPDAQIELGADSGP